MAKLGVKYSELNREMEALKWKHKAMVIAGKKNTPECFILEQKIKDIHATMIDVCRSIGTHIIN